MADIDISMLDEKSRAALLEALTKSSRKKVDYTNMTDTQRKRLNANIEPVGDSPLWTEFPKWQYGNVNGQIVGTLVEDEKELKKLHADHPDAKWKDLLRDWGIETCPSKPASTSGKAFVTMGQAPVDVARDVRNDPVPEPLVIPTLSIEQLTRGQKIAKGKADAKARRSA